MGIQLIRERPGRGIVLFVLTCKKAHSLLVACAVQHLAFQNIAFKRFQELQGPAHTDTKGIYAAFKAFEVAAFEDSYQSFFATFLELVTGYALILVGFQPIGCELQSLDAVHQLIVNASIGSFQVIPYRLQSAFGPTNGLALDGGIGIGFLDKGASTPYDYLFQQIEESYATFLLEIGPAGGLKVPIKVTDSWSSKGTAVPSRKWVCLIL